jgi:hypothetical protein
VVEVSLQAQRFLGVHAVVLNFFNLGRHLVSAGQYRDLWVSAFAESGLLELSDIVVIIKTQTQG